MTDDEDLVLRALRRLADQPALLHLAEHEYRNIRRQNAFLPRVGRIGAGKRGEHAADDAAGISLPGRGGWFLDGLDRLHVRAVEIDADAAGRVLDQALAVLHVAVDGRGARAAFLATMTVAFVINFLALDLGFEIGAGLLRELRSQRRAYPQRSGHFDDLTRLQRRHRAGAADRDRRHDVELAGDPRAPP